uniref:Os01g0778100 protein n=1 Tax=Macrostomum lignano TaxID=282301 RepID=A0A1I8IYB5_9PLAT
VYRPLYMMDCRGGAGGGGPPDCLAMQEHFAPINRSNHTFGRAVPGSPRSQQQQQQQQRSSSRRLISLITSVATPKTPAWTTLDEAVPLRTSNQA